MFELFAQDAPKANALSPLVERLLEPQIVVWIFLAICVISGVIAGTIKSYFNHRERMLKTQERIAMIEQGMIPDPEQHSTK